MTKALHRARVAVTAVALLAVSRSAIGGPPFNTERAATIEQYHTEIDIFAQSTTTDSGTSATFPGLQIDYGVLPNLQVRLVAPVSLAGTGSQAAGYGVGDVQFGAKYRLVEGGDDTWLPQVSIFPEVLIPTGNSHRDLGQGHTSVKMLKIGRAHV